MLCKAFQHRIKRSLIDRNYDLIYKKFWYLLFHHLQSGNDKDVQIMVAEKLKQIETCRLRQIESNEIKRWNEVGERLFQELKHGSINPF